MRRKNPVPDRPPLPERPPLPLRWSRVAALIVCLLVCAALLPVGACGVAVKPSGQVATGISVGR